MDESSRLNEVLQMRSITSNSMGRQQDQCQMKYINQVLTSSENCVDN